MRHGENGACVRASQTASFFLAARLGHRLQLVEFFGQPQVERALAAEVVQQCLGFFQRITSDYFTVE
jgi:hypothetical protein